MDRAPDNEREPVHDFAHGEIQTYVGGVNRWLIAVYVVLALWAGYYLVTAWGGLGPGLEMPR